MTGNKPALPASDGVKVFRYFPRERGAPYVAIAMRGEDVAFVYARQQRQLEKLIKKMVARYYVPETAEEASWACQEHYTDSLDRAREFERRPRP